MHNNKNAKSKLADLFNQQLANFDLAKTKYRNLEQVIYKDIDFGKFVIRIQHNPDRIVSTAANIAPEAIRQRKCFLCEANMPAQQKGIEYRDNYKIFINPYPIFNPHFTIPATKHIAQEIKEHFDTLLDLVYDFEGYTAFYNGAECGASAPDHFHFQMTLSKQMPIEKDYKNEEIFPNAIVMDNLTVKASNNYPSSCLVIISNDKEEIKNTFGKINTILLKIQKSEGEETMFNLISWYDNNQWKLCIYPRKARRPKEFYLEGDKQILFSPGCVDMGGLIIAPRKQDYDRYNRELLTTLFRQISIEPENMDLIISQLRLTYN